MTDRIWVLGAADPEMSEIESLLAKCGEQVAYATGPDGQRVHQGNAYRAGSLGADAERIRATGGEIIVIECGLDPSVDWTGLDSPGQIDCAAVVTRCDHHRPGDPGYGRPPREFLIASSIGQVIAHLARLVRLPAWTDCRSEVARDVGSFGLHHWMDPASEWDDGVWRSPPAALPVWFVKVTDRHRCLIIPQPIVHAAAADHCLAAAYQGECPGVDPDRLMLWRAESRASHQGRSVDDVLADVERARSLVREAVTPDGMPRQTPQYADMRGPHIPELPEAAALEGIPFIATVRDRDGREKVVMQAAPPDLVERFLAGDVIADLFDTYGDPQRGFAGGYVT